MRRAIPNTGLANLLQRTQIKWLASANEAGEMKNRKHVEEIFLKVILTVTIMTHSSAKYIKGYFA